VTAAKPPDESAPESRTWRAEVTPARPRGELTPEPPPAGAAVRPAPTATRNPIRLLFTVQDVQRRWPFALRAGICMAVPVMIGLAAGDVPAGLIATIGSFTSLYGSRRPYHNRAVHLAVVAVCFALVVALGNWAAQVPWAGVLTVSAIAMVAVLVCNALAVEPPGAYMFVLACAAGIGAEVAHLPAWRIGLLVLAGGALSWLVHMSGAFIRFRGPEKSAVAAAADAVARFVDATGTSREAPARHLAAQDLHQSWSVLVNFQPAHARPTATLNRLRATNHELHILFAEVMNAAVNNEPVPADAAKSARRLGALAKNPGDVDDVGDLAEMPLGRPGPIELLRQAIIPGSYTLHVAARAGIAVFVAGTVASALSVDHAYWAMSAAVLMLYQGLDWTRTLQRSIERLLGTWIGLVLAGLILVLHPQGPWLVLVIALLQFTIEMLVVRNYALAVVFMTPAALTIASGGERVSDIAGLLLARGVDTLIGCVAALAVYLLTARLHGAGRLRDAIALTLDAVAATSRHLARGEPATKAARIARRDLQIRAIAMLPIYDTAIGGSLRERTSAERMWPAVVATEQLAYRTLAACWAMERVGGGEAAHRLGQSLFGPGGVDRFTAAVEELAGAVRTGSAPPSLEPSPFGGAEMTTLRDSLVRDPG
jgi:uncharacterized membrane protein YccC